MIEIKMYAVSAATAEALKLTKIRRRDEAGRYLLSSVDLQGYGIDRAVAEGAEVLMLREARERFALK
jgi:hypothetical protein